MYQYKNINFGFVIICPVCNSRHLKSTISSVDSYYSTTNKLVVLPKECKEEIRIKKCFSDSALASMINTGMSKTECTEWNFIIFAGGVVKARLELKYSCFIDNQKEILFPIIGRKLNFAESEFTLLLIHKKSFDEIGDFPKENSFETSKIKWAATALEKGYRFKGIVGGKPFYTIP